MGIPTNGNKIKFQYVSNYSSITTWDNDTVYFIADVQPIKGIAERVEKVRQKRNSASSTASQKSRNNPHRFRETNTTSKGHISIIALTTFLGVKY